MAVPLKRLSALTSLSISAFDLALILRLPDAVLGSCKNLHIRVSLYADDDGAQLRTLTNLRSLHSDRLPTTLDPALASVDRLAAFRL